MKTAVKVLSESLESSRLALAGNGPTPATRHL